MTRRYLPYYMLLLLLISGCSDLQSQELFSKAAGERIQACTDRTLYVSGENILFTALIYNVKDPTAGKFSRILYCELITPEGKKIAGHKYLVNNSSAQGCIAIPEETISGIYFLKFYTHFMRNTGTNEYKFILLKIVNPVKTEVLQGHDIPDTTTRAGNEVKPSEGGLNLNILPGKKDFSRREEIRLNINVNSGKGLPAKLCLTVIPESTFNTSIFQHIQAPDSAQKVLYFPETRGLSLSGKVMEKASGKPVPGAKVNLSIIGDRDIMVVNTDTNGRFFFALPDYTGNKDIFLCCGEMPDITPEILIDNDFCSRPVNLPSLRFTLDSGEMKAAYQLVVNFRVTSMFGMDTPDNAPTGEAKNPSFYGKPSEVLIMDKFIDLPTLEEYFTQLPSGVNLRKVDGKHQFRFFTTKEEMSFYEPLLLVDWVAVSDIEKILAMSPKAIERIELVNSPYVKGNITYGGIISFVSKKNDFAGIDLPKSGTFVNYNFLDECNEIIPLGTLPSNIPDSRNTFYWNPDVQTNTDGASSVSFPAPDAPGKYRILLRGINKTGKVIYTEETFTVH